MAYAELEPFDETRADVRAASICSLLANIHRDTKKKREPFTIADFLLVYGDDVKPASPKKRQTWQEQKLIGQMMAIAFNEPPRKRKTRGN